MIAYWHLQGQIQKIQKEEAGTLVGLVNTVNFTENYFQIMQILTTPKSALASCCGS